MRRKHVTSNKKGDIKICEWDIVNNSKRVLCLCNNCKNFYVTWRSQFYTSIGGCDCRKPYSERLYSIWSNMKTRCYNKKTKVYQYYGKKGISVCKDWNIYKNFERWALNNGYNDTLTIDRIDLDGNYEPSNNGRVIH